MARVLDYIFFRLSTAVGWLAAERDWCVLHWPSGLITFSVFLLLLGQPFETETRPLSLRWCVYLIRLVMWWASFSYLCLQGTSFGELEKTRAPSSVFKYKRNIQNCSTMEYHRWLVDDFFPFRCGPHPTTTNKT